MTGAFEKRQRNALRFPAEVPFFADSGGTLPAPAVRTTKRYVFPSITGSTQASRPFFVESMKVEARGTSAFAKAGLGLRTVRAHSYAITVSARPS